MAHDLGKESRWLGMYITGDIGPLTFYTSQRAKLVAFPRAPPLVPPSTLQETFREYFRQAATAWRGLTNDERANWLEAATRCNLAIHGYDLWTWYYRTRADDELRTIERQSGLSLTRP